jgi:hypothetical protein
MKDMKTKNNERGSATVIAVLVLGLLTIFVALAISRTTSEAMVMANDTSEGRSYNAAEASLELMTRNFNKVFDVKLFPSASDLTAIQTATPPGFSGFDFNQSIVQTQAPEQVVLSGGSFQGLNATRDKWKVQTITTDKSTGVKVIMMREFYNNRIPIFQFGVFYNDNMEYHPGPKFAFGGRVHSNGSIFMMASTGLYFASRVTAVDQIVTEVARNGSPWSYWNENVWVKNASGTYVKLTHNMGSVLNTVVNGPNLWGDGLNCPQNCPNDDPDMPAGYRNANWQTYKALFDNNLLNEVKPLNLPLRNGGQVDTTKDYYVELLKRPKTTSDLYNDGTGVVPVPAPQADNGITANERFANKRGVRVSLADSKAKLPGCASGVGQTPVTTPCGVRLDGDALGQGVYVTGARGYQPLPMQDGYLATRVNGDRLYVPGREVWIKVELVSLDTTTGLPVTQDVTEDILSLGVTEECPSSSNFKLWNYHTGAGVVPGNVTPDSRSIIKLQRFAIPGVDIKNGVSSNWISYRTDAGGINIVQRYDNYPLPSPSPTPTPLPVDNAFLDDDAHLKAATFTGGTLYSNYNKRIVPFPIEMFDTREGLYNDSISISTTYPGGIIPLSGVMSVIDIDVANLRRFLRGDWDNLLPNGTPYQLATTHSLRSFDVPNANGWVFYVSDRRGDYDFDGEYDMEDIYGNNDGILQKGEDINKNGLLDTDFVNEAVTYLTTGQPDEYAVKDHRAYRRAVRLINGQQLPGIYDAANPNNTEGFTVASENAVYVKGNYNATGVISYDNPTPSTKYLPQNTADHIPAAVIADAVMILSNNWNDAKSFRYPFSRSNRVATETTVRFAMLSGDALSSLNALPNQGGGDPRLNGGVHNFKRFLEHWSGVYLNYSGSLINLYNSHNNNGAFKCCTNVYSPPNRNWIFDATFLDPTRLPPGTPFFQYIEVTGFLRINN